jgi:hypothetical protein
MAKDPAARFPNAAAFGQVARRTAAGLASGTSTAIGPSGSPVSAPPVPIQTSPGPVGTGAVPRPPVAGGTRVMPAGGFAAVPPTGSPVAPGSPVGPGAGYHRGAAVVPPPPPPRSDTTYLPGQPPPGGSSGRSTLVILAVLVSLLVLLGVGFVAWNLLNRTGGPANPTATGTPANNRQTTGQPTATGRLVSTFCKDARGRTWGKVESVLKADGFQPNRVDVPGPLNRVVELTPCQAVRGSVVTVKVGNGQPAGPGTDPGGGGGGGSTAPGGGGQGGGGTSPSCTGLGGIGGGIGACPTPPAKQG